MLRDSEELLESAVSETVAALTLQPEDVAAVSLAMEYARSIDASHDDARGHASAMRWIAPQLLDVLEALGATPAARNRLKGGRPADAAPNRIAQLRAARRA